MISTTAWLVLQPERRGYDGKVVSIEITKMLKNKPKLGVREVGIQLIVEVDPAMFADPDYEVTIRLDDRRAILIPSVETVELEGGGMVTLADEAEPVPVPDDGFIDDQDESP